RYSGSNGRLGNGVIRVGMGSGNASSTLPGEFELGRVAGADEIEKDWNAFKAIAAEVLAPHDGWYQVDLIFAQDLAEQPGRLFGQLGIVVNGRREEIELDANLRLGSPRSLGRRLGDPLGPLQP